MVIRTRLPISGRAIVFVTTTVKDWAPVFNIEEVAQAVLTQFAEALEYYRISLVGYVLMPSHLHALLGLKQIESLSRFMQSFKILSSKRVKQIPALRKYQCLYKGTSFGLWMPRFDDLIITSEEQFRIKLEYIHQNPMRAGLVENAGDWPYSSASEWLHDRPGLLKIDKDFRWQA